MSNIAVKSMEYDVNACMLYDYMIQSGFNEEIVAQQMGLTEEQTIKYGEKMGKSAWTIIHRWIQSPASIPYHYMFCLCKALNAPCEAMFMQSRLLNRR